jgi:hypothetical protein
VTLLHERILIVNLLAAFLQKLQTPTQVVGRESTADLVKMHNRLFKRKEVITLKHQFESGSEDDGADIASDGSQ